MARRWAADRLWGAHPKKTPTRGLPDGHRTENSLRHKVVTGRHLEKRGAQDTKTDKLRKKRHALISTLLVSLSSAHGEFRQMSAAVAALALWRQSHHLGPAPNPAIIE